MTGTSSSRRHQVALAVIALGAFALRAFPFLGPDGAWSYRVDYDEGVYFSAASLLFKGLLPYREFVFVHPPGILLFLAATSAWTHSFLGVDGAFALSRWIAAGIGTVNVLLVARLVRGFGVRRDASPLPLGALFAAAFYATYPEVVQVERGPFLEPLLNLVCLSMSLVVMNAGERPQRARWLLLGGLLAGLAVSIKVWAVIWLAGALWAVAGFASWREVLLFVGAAALACGLIVVPFAAQAPGDFFTEVGLFHLWRPPDGLTDRLARVEQIVALRHLASPLLAAVMVALLVLRRGNGWNVPARIFGSAWVLTLAAFFASSAYWAQYNAHLIASEAVLAGALLASLSPAGGRLGLRGATLLVALLSCLGLSLFHAIRRSQGTDQHLALARSPLRNVDDCVFTFEPGWSLAAGRLPPRLTGTQIVIDTYADQLLGAVSGGKRFTSAEAAFAATPSVASVLVKCRYVIFGDRGVRQLSPASLEKLRATRTLEEFPGLQVWEQL